MLTGIPASTFARPAAEAMKVGENVAGLPFMGGDFVQTDIETML
ncbi:hypothetical protein [Shinella zoogloeoides]|nr:hypothetical protein [Shinella zoogloeoides]WLR93628.1 hypothetical protein Q9316_05395 [Shinella zoogloeoides]